MAGQVIAARLVDMVSAYARFPHDFIVKCAQQPDHYQVQTSTQAAKAEKSASGVCPCMRISLNKNQ